MVVKPLLLLDQPTGPREALERRLLRLGPWAYPEVSPDQLGPILPEAYPSDDAVASAARASMERAGSLLARLSVAVPRATGLGADLPGRFWEVFLLSYLSFVCGQAEDISRRCALFASESPDIGTATTQLVDAPQDLHEFHVLILSRSRLRLAFMEACARAALPDAGFVPVVYREQPPVKPPRKSALRGFFSKGKRFILGRLLRAAATGQPEKVLLWEAYKLGWSELLRLARLGLPLYRPELHSIASRPTPLDEALREKAFEEFEEPYRSVLRLTFPKAALEGLGATLKAAREIVDSLPAGRPRRLLSFGQAWSAAAPPPRPGPPAPGRARAPPPGPPPPPPPPAAAAIMAAEGTRIWSVQHGGGYGGTYRCSPNASMEFRLADRFVGWGWEPSDEPLARPEQVTASPSIHLKRARQRPGDTYRWKILFFLHTDSVYTRWLYPTIFPDMAEDYFKRERALLDALSAEQPSAAKIYSVEFGWRHEAWLRHKNPKLEIIKTGTLPGWSRQAELTITDYSSTGFLELLALDRPFLATWNRRWFRGSASFERHLDALREAGVFHETPASLAAEYQHARLDLERWWSEPRRRDAVRGMARRFAWASDDAYERLRDLAYGPEPAGVAEGARS